MENKVGYAYISLGEYKELIEKIKTLEYQIKDDQNIIKNIRENYENIEKTIFEKIYKNERYYIKNYDCIGNYHHNQLVIEFQKYGYTSTDKINEQIQKLVERYNEEGENKENE